MTNSNRFRKILEQRLDELKSRVADLDQILQSPLPADFEEQANDLENQVSMEALEERDRREILAIKSAMKRIENGTFGTCISCGDPIPEDRLNALPTALRCMPCEQKR